MPTLDAVLRSATTLPEPPAPSSWPWIEIGKIRHLRRPRYELPIRDLPEALHGLRIVHLSDIHVDRTWMPGWDELHRWLAENPPDLICITGDWVDKKHDHRPALPLLDRFLNALTARLGVWGILGNHDTDLLPLRAADGASRSTPVHTLFNERVTLAHGDATLEIIGLHGVHPQDTSQEVLTKLIEPRRANVVRIMLSHFPAHVLKVADAGVDLVLAGHTHGGQVCLPGGIPLMTHDRLPSRFARGAHRIGGSWLVTSRGCGFSKYPIRVFCPAEAIEIVLVRQIEQSNT